MTTYSQIAPSRIINNGISLNESKIIHFIPDFNTNFITYRDVFPFKLVNIQSLIVKSNIIRIGSITLNPKQYFIDVKKEFGKTSNIIPDQINQNKFIIIDHSPVMEAIFKINEISGRRALFLLFNYIKNEFQFSKSLHPNVEHVTLLSFHNNGLIETISNNIAAFKSKEEMFKFFDNYTLIHVNESVIPFLYYKKTNVFIDISALNRIKKEVELITPINPIDQQQNTLNSTVSGLENTSVKPTIKNTISDKIYPEEKISNNILAQTLKTEEIKNDNVENNIKIAVSNQLILNPNSSEEEINQIVLKTINKTIYGTDEISQEYLDNPQLLIKKLKVYDEYSDKLTTFNTSNNFINPDLSLIPITKITGPCRHKYEFSNNIHVHVEKLFKTLESKNNPIEVVNITHAIKDNNIDRFIEYDITLKNKIGYSEPYTIKLRVPHLINDRYFKLNGKEYILSSQQFLKPITKNTPTEARFLSHFSMITEKLVNFKYSPSDISSIINYIANTYPSLVYKYNKAENRIEFNDGSLIDLNSKIPFSHNDLELVNEHGKYHLYKNNQKIETTINKTEFIFNHLFNLINSVNPSDTLKNSSRNVQYVEIHVMGPHMPLILAIWQQLGLTEALIKFGINFELKDELPDIANNFTFLLNDNKYLVLYPKSKREEYIINGLYKLPFIHDLTSNDLSKRESCYNYLVNTYSTKILNNLDNMIENSIDPTTKEILEFDNLPTNIIDIITGPLVDKLFNDEPDHPSDLSTLRVRMSEYMTQLMYTEIHNPVSLYSNI